MGANSEQNFDLSILNDDIQNGIYVTDANQNIIYVNTAFADFLGYTKKELIGKDIRDLYVNHENRKILEDCIKKRKGKIANYLVYLKRKNGEIIYFSCNDNWVPGDKLKSTWGSGRDQTDLINFMGAFFQIDSDGLITFCSDKFSELFKSESPDKIIGKQIDRFFDEKSMIIEICDNAIKDNHCCWMLQSTIKDEDGLCKKVITKMNVNAMHQKINGKLEKVGYQGTLEDITDAEKAEEHLRESHKMNELLWKQSKDGLFLIQGNHVVMANESFCKIVGYSENELKIMFLGDLIHDDHKYIVQNEFYRKLSKEERPPFSFKIRTKNGKIKNVMAISAHCLVNKIDSIYGYLIDFTELEEKIENKTKELGKSVQDKKFLLDMIVHGISSPTAAIRGENERLKLSIKRGKDPIESQLKRLENIDEMCQFISIVENNVRIINSESIDWKANTERLHLERDLLSKAIYYIRPLIKNRGLPEDKPVEIYMKGTPPYIKVNYEFFHQAFFNILSNAVKFAKKDPAIFKIEINSSFSFSEGTTLFFMDWGIGIPREDKDKVFSERGRGSNATDIPGMGIGMSVTKKILDAYDCKIWIERFNDPTTIAVKIPYKLIDAQR